MKNKLLKRIFAIGLTAVMAVSMIAGCGSKGDDKGSSGTDADSGEGLDASFTWWIYKTDGSGTYYDDYKDSPVVQFINSQYWDVENGGIGTEETGRKLDLSFLVPIAGSEGENFSTMISTGEYPEILDLNGSTENAQSLYESGILMDITEYVEKYMPNYLAFLDSHPELKPLVSVLGEDGEIHYYALYELKDGVADPWYGPVYRRDWLVKYAEPTEYVWDWESEVVKENGHPAVTPLEKALEEENLDGWKKNEVTAFSATPGTNPDEEYEDNVIFPSGTGDPITVSDWEWMFEAFAKAIEERGWADNSGAYCMTIEYTGYSLQGDLVSSFGGGNGFFYVRDGEVSFDGTSDNFKAYVECLSTWYENGWMDTQFHTRASDMFFSINTTGTTQGMVGLWGGMPNSLGTGIRTTCANEEDKQDAFVMAAAYPINDVYGKEEQMYHEPDSLYQDSRRGGGMGITHKAEGKDLAALFTFFDWGYTEEGSLTQGIGLSEEQLASVELNPNLYADYDLNAAYTVSTDEDGKTVYHKTVDSSNDLVNAIHGGRLGAHYSMTGNTGEYTIDKGDTHVATLAKEQWTKYLNTGSIMDYNALLKPEESEEFSKIMVAVTDYQKQNLPGVIMGGMDMWDEYAKGLDALGAEAFEETFQKYVSLSKTEE